MDEETDDITEGLSIVRIDKTREEATRFDGRFSRTCGAKTIYEIVDVELCVNRIKYPSVIPLNYKNTECELVVNRETSILTKNNSISSKAIIKREDRYIKYLDDPERYPLTCLCIIDEYYYSLFEGINPLEQKSNAIGVFSRLSLQQQNFIVAMSDRPKVGDDPVKEIQEDVYSPIRDENALRVMYQLCRSTY